MAWAGVSEQHVIEVHALDKGKPPKGACFLKEALFNIRESTAGTVADVLANASVGSQRFQIVSHGLQDAHR